MRAATVYSLCRAAPVRHDDVDRRAACPTRDPTAGKVRGNTRNGVYWWPGTEYYGKTKQGNYMTEAEAVKAGYRPPGGQ